MCLLLCLKAVCAHPCDQLPPMQVRKDRPFLFAQVLQELIDEARSVVGLFTDILTANATSPEVLATDDICQQVVSQSKRVQVPPIITFFRPNPRL